MPSFPSSVQLLPAECDSVGSDCADAEVDAPTMRVGGKSPMSAKVAALADEGMLGRFGGYDVKRKIAAGGMGTVWEAEDLGLHRMVALKTMRGAVFSETEAKMRFRAEAEAAAALDHSSIVPIYEIGEVLGLPFFAMKLIEGESLADRLKRGPLAPRDAAVLLQKLAGAVDHAHQCGVLHRDLKPANVLIDRSGSPWLTDFGLAKLAHDDLELTGPCEVLGTPQFMSPEQVRGGKGSVTTGGDVWAMGAMFYYMLSGRMAFEGKDHMEIFHKIVTTEPVKLETLVPGCDRELVTLVERCMEKDSERRMSSAGELADELGRWLAGEPIRSRSMTAGERMWRWMRRYPYRVAAIALVMLSVLGGGATSLVMWGRAYVANVSLLETNGVLEKSLRLSTVRRLASESMVQMNEEPALGLLLAVESAETTLRADGKVLPDSLNALVNGLQRVSGVDATPGRGMAEGDRAYRQHVAARSFFRVSPDGQSVLMLSTMEEGIIAGLYDVHSLRSDVPRMVWHLEKGHGMDLGVFDVVWTEDSRRILSVAGKGRVVREWTLVGEDGRALEAGVAPPMREVGILGGGVGEAETAHFVMRGDAAPMVYYMAVVEGEFRAYRQAIKSGDAAALASPEVVKDGPMVRGRLAKYISTPDGRWLLFFSPYEPTPPLLIDTKGGGVAVTRLPAPPAIFYAQAFSADGRWLALGCVDGSVWVFDLHQADASAIGHSMRLVYTRASTVQCLAFSPDGSLLAMGGDDSTVQVLMLEGERKLHHLSMAGPSVPSLAFSADNRWLAAGAGDGAVRAWKVAGIERGLPALEFRGLSTPVHTVGFGADGRSLIAQARGGEGRRWLFNGSSTGAIPMVSAEDGHPVRALAVSPDGRWIAAAGQPAVSLSESAGEVPVRLLDVHAGLAEYPLPGHAEPTGVAISMDGRWLASTGLDARVRLWDLWELTAAVDAGGVPPAPRTMYVRDTREVYQRRLAFHPSGRLYSTCGDGLLFEWDLTKEDVPSTYREHRLHSIGYILTDVAVSPDGRWLAVGRHGYDTKPKEGQTQFGNMVLLFDVSDPDRMVPRAEFHAPFQHFGTVAFSHDSHWLSAGSRDMPPVVWDLAAEDIGASVKNVPLSVSMVEGVAFLRPTHFPVGGPWAVFGGADGRLNLWDWQSGEANMRRYDAGSVIHSCAVLPDGRLVSGSRDGRVRVWETSPVRLIDLAREMAGRRLMPVERVRFGIAK